LAAPREAVKPHVVLAPAASEPLYGMFRWPFGHVQVTVHPVMAADPAVTVTAPWKPLPQSPPTE
jgi:hypothetical protein